MTGGKEVIVSLLFTLMVVTAIGQNELRVRFHQQMNSESGLQALLRDVSGKTDLLSQAYAGLAETMMAQYAFWPLEKLDYFNQGKEKIEKVITSDSQNPEWRYIRLMVQLNAPSLLGYHDQVEGDLTFFISRYKDLEMDDKWCAVFIDNLLSASGLQGTQEKKLISMKSQCR